MRPRRGSGGGFGGAAGVDAGAARGEAAAGRAGSAALGDHAGDRRAARRSGSARMRGMRRAGPACRGGAARRRAARPAPVSTMRPAYITTTRSRDLGHHAEVVGDEQHRDAELLPQAGQQLEDLRLDGDVERGGRLVRDQQARGGRPAPWRSSPAGACRPRAGADRRRRAARRSGMPTWPQQRDRPAPCAARAAEPQVAAQRLGDLRRRSQHRVQRGHRVLEDHGDAVAAQPLPCARFRQLQRCRGPRSSTAPAGGRLGRFSRPHEAMAVMLLPLPLSPTTPRVSPRPSSKEMPSTARSTCGGSGIWTVSSRTESRGAMASEAVTVLCHSVAGKRQHGMRASPPAIGQARS